MSIQDQEYPETYQPNAHHSSGTATMKLILNGYYIEELARRLSAAVDTLYDPNDDDCGGAPESAVWNTLILASADELRFVVTSRRFNASISLIPSLLGPEIIQVESTGACVVKGIDVLRAIGSGDGMHPFMMELWESDDHLAATLELSSKEFSKKLSLKATLATAESQAAGRHSDCATITADKFVNSVWLAGRVASDEDWSDVLWRETDGKLEIVATNGRMLGRSFLPAAKCPKGMRVIVPIKALLATMGMCLDNQPFSFHVDTKGFLNISQDVDIFGEVVGRVLVTIEPASLKTFHPYEPLIKSLKVVGTCKVQCAHLRAACEWLDLVDRNKTVLKLDPPVKGCMRITVAGSESNSETVVPVSDATGTKLEVKVSKQHLRLVAENCPGDEVVLSFSGPNSLVQAKLGDGLDFYFNPFLTPAAPVAPQQ